VNCSARHAITTFLVGFAVSFAAVPAHAQALNPRAFVTEPGEASEEPTAPTYLFLDGPIDPVKLGETLANPDFVILKGSEYLRLDGIAKKSSTKNELPAFGFQSLDISGSVKGNLAGLSVHYDIVLAVDDVVTVPLRLDSQIVGSAVEGTKPVKLKATPEAGWSVELQGRGHHRVQLGLLVPVKETAEGPRIELAIPEVSSTTIDIEMEPGITDVRIGGKAPLAVAPVEVGPRSRVKANLTARSMIDVSWRVVTDPASQGPAILTAQGEIGIEVDRGTLRALSSWTVKCERGAARELRVRLDRADELLGIELDGQPLPIETSVNSENEVVIALSEPLRSGSTRKLNLTTRRQVPAGATARLEFKGFPIEGATGQSGVLSIAQGADLGLTAEAGRGLRQIDPKQELPSTLRARPGTGLAYQFVEQPFDLRLRIDPSPPLIRVDGRTTVAVRPGRADVDTTLDYRVTRGRIFEIAVALPSALEFDSAGPPSVVASYQLTDQPEEAPGGQFRLLVLRLTPEAREARTFSVHLTGRQRLATAATVTIGLFTPRNATGRGGLLAVVPARNVGVDLADTGSDDEGRDQFLPYTQEIPASWTWPVDRPVGTGTSPVWFRYEGSASHLPLRLVQRTRMLHHETALTAKVERSGIDLRQETQVRIRNAILTQLDVVVPARFEGRWETTGEEVSARTKLSTTPEGDARYRLSLVRENSESLRLRFRVKLPFDAPLSSESERPLSWEWIRIEEGTASPLRLSVSSEQGIRFDAKPGWAKSAADASSADRSSGLLWVGPETEAPPPLSVRALSIATLPPVLATRLWLRSVAGRDGSVTTSAFYRLEGGAAELHVILPARSVWLRGRVGEETIQEVERLARPDEYRLRLPSSMLGPLIVSFEYRVPPDSARAPWKPPILGDGVAVQQTFWEVILPYDRAAFGVPKGWGEENAWYWDGYVFKRRPSMSPSQLAAWIAGPSGQSALMDRFAGAAQLSSHPYLFGRMGSPATLNLAIFSKAEMVGLFSGLSLLCGIVFLLWKPRSTLAGLIILAGLLAAAATLHPSTILAGAQAGLVGVALTVLAALTQRVVDRRKPITPLYHEPSGLSGSPGGIESRNGALRVGSEESTVIRARGAATTVDHVEQVDATVIRVAAPGNTP
jgi:hypothetical protein